MGAEPASIFYVVAIGEFGIRKALHISSNSSVQGPGVHGQERSARALGELDEILPAVGIIPHIPHDALDLFVVHKAVETAHAMAFDEGNHVVFYGREIVWNGRHRQLEIIIVCRSEIGCQRARIAGLCPTRTNSRQTSQKSQCARRGSGRRHQAHKHLIELLSIQIELDFDLMRGVFAALQPFQVSVFPYPAP